MTNTTKMTNKMALSFVLENCEVPADVAEKLNGMLAQLEKKSGAERKPSARQVENGNIKEVILGQMENGRLYSISEIIKEFDNIPADMSSQRMSALMTQLVADNKVVRTVDKRKVYFSLAD